jgi:ABC-2 type transport system ATP-binding protein
VSRPAVVVDDVSKRFRLYRERNQSLKVALMRGGRARYNEFWALRDVSFDIPEGETFALVGENGSGKSTLLNCIARILRPDRGTITTQGRVAALLELGSGFHPELPGRENVYLNGSILGMSRREIDSRFDEIVGFAGVEDFIDQPVKNYSSGMYVRLGFAVAVHVNPDILLVDEVLAVGDAAFQTRCAEKFADFRRAGKTVVVVSHAMATVRTMCDRAAWLNHGRLIRVDRAEKIVDDYLDEGHAERQEIAGGGARWGSGEALLTDIQVLDSGGTAQTRFRTGDEVVVRLGYRTTEAIPRPVFGLALENLDGVYVWAHNTRDAGFVPDRIDGTGSVELRIPRLMLQPGTFDLIASIVDYQTVHTFDFLRHCYRFDVDPGHPRESGGIVAFGGEWQNLRQEGTERADVSCQANGKG